MKALAPVSLCVAAVLATGACADTTSLTAQNPVFSEQITVFALTGSTAALPSALHTPSLTPVRADGGFNFDIAFDIDAQGRAVLYPMSMLVISTGTRTHPVGLQKLTVPFDSLTRAPNSGYVADAPLTLAVGEGAVIESTLPNLCGYPYPLTIYSKIVVDSIKPAARSIHLHATVDPNCGFRSFLLGVPVS